MSQRSETSFPLFGIVFGIAAIIGNFLAGLLLGLAAPLAAIAAIVAGIRFLTGKVPFLSDISEDEDGKRRLSLQLVSPEEAKELYYEHKEQIGGELAWMKDELQAMAREVKAEMEAEAEAQERNLELQPEAEA
jgi:hypothetical protein